MTRRISPRLLVLAPAALALTLGACAPRAIREAPDIRAAAESIYARYAATLGAGNADAWAELWADDGVQLPPDAPPVVGKSQIREKLRGVLDAFRFDMQIRTEEARSAGGWASARGTYTATLTPKRGGDPVPIDGKFLTIFARQPDGSWKIYRDIFNSNVPPRSR